MRLALTLAALLLAMPVSGSLLEDQGVSYQFDGDTHQDAPDACQQADPAWQLRAHNTTDGMLVPQDDESDLFVFNATGDLGGRFTVSLEEASTLAATVRATLDVLVPSCAGSVLDIGNGEPWEPQPGPAEQVAEPSNVGGGVCSDRWFFIINGVDAAAAPPTVRLGWTDGYIEDVPMDDAPPEPVGQYQTTSRLDVTLHSAWAILPDDWTGNFRVGERPCDAQAGGAIYAPATRMGDSITFSVIGDEPYVIWVQLDEVEVNDPTEPVPVNCHHWCLPGSDMVNPEDTANEVSYQLLAHEQADEQDA